MQDYCGPNYSRPNYSGPFNRYAFKRPVECVKGRELLSCDGHKSGLIKVLKAKIGATHGQWVLYRTAVLIKMKVGWYLFTFLV